MAAAYDPLSEDERAVCIKQVSEQHQCVYIDDCLLHDIANRRITMAKFVTYLKHESPSRHHDTILLYLTRGGHAIPETGFYEPLSCSNVSRVKYASTTRLDEFQDFCHAVRANSNIRHLHIHWYRSDEIPYPTTEAEIASEVACLDAIGSLLAAANLESLRISPIGLMNYRGVMKHASCLYNPLCGSRTLVDLSILDNLYERHGRVSADTELALARIPTLRWGGYIHACGDDCGPRFSVASTRLMQTRSRDPFIAFLLYQRELTQRGRSTAHDPRSMFGWLMTTAPLWVFARVCVLFDTTYTHVRLIM
jgi:hypothetical protein